MKHTLLFIIALLTISCDNIISSPERPKTAQELRQELKSKEEQTPSLYLQEEGVVLKPKRKIVKKATFFKFLALTRVKEDTHARILRHTILLRRRIFIKS